MQARDVAISSIGLASISAVVLFCLFILHIQSAMRNVFCSGLASSLFYLLYPSSMIWCAKISIGALAQSPKIKQVNGCKSS